MMFHTIGISAIFSGRYHSDRSPGSGEHVKLTKSQLIHAFYDPAIYVYKPEIQSGQKGLAGSGAEDR